MELIQKQFKKELQKRIAKKKSVMTRAKESKEQGDKGTKHNSSLLGYKKQRVQRK